MYELVIRNGRLIDGSGAPARLADVAVLDGRIAEVGIGVGAGRREIDAAGSCWSRPASSTSTRTTTARPPGTAR
ncbi:MAG: hypothetical protein R3E48_08105 [Burkholderiaceae bacterium]